MQRLDFTHSLGNYALISVDEIAKTALSATNELGLLILPGTLSTHLNGIISLGFKGLTGFPF